MKFFYGCISQEEAKTIYKKLAKCFHPDKGGSNELMIELQKQYDNWNEPIIAHNAYTQQMYTPNNFGFSPGRFNMAGDLGNSLEVNRLKNEIDTLKRDKCYLKDKLNLLETMYKELCDTYGKLDEENYSLKHIIDEMKITNEAFTKEIARLIKLKEPKTILGKFKEYISA